MGFSPAFPGYKRLVSTFLCSPIIEKASLRPQIIFPKVNWTLGMSDLEKGDGALKKGDGALIKLGGGLGGVLEDGAIGTSGGCGRSASCDTENGAPSP